jgi:hypothetical protein
MQSKQKVCVHEMEALSFIGSKQIVQSSTGHTAVLLVSMPKLESYLQT